MKRFLSLFLVLMSGGFLTPASAAVRNLCQAQKAEFKEVSQGDTAYTLCLFGEAVVGAETLQKATSEKETPPQALAAFKKGETSRISGGVCGSFGASLLEAKDREGNNYNLCHFSDGSLIEETTLWLGADSLLGEKLSRILAKINES